MLQACSNLMESIEIELYVSEEGKCPFKEWHEQLDKVHAVRVEERLSRIREGNFGDARRISEGIWELRMFHGSGYRAYYHVPAPGKMVILCAGDNKWAQKWETTLRHSERSEESQRDRSLIASRAAESRGFALLSMTRRHDFDF